MEPRIVVLSGPVGAGKSTLREMLVKRHGFQALRTQDLIRELSPDVANDRASLQAAGEALDRQHGGKWVCDALVRTLTRGPDDVEVVVDAARIPAQVDAIRGAYGPRVTHVHLKASLSALERRYAERPPGLRELASYAEVCADPTEADIGAMEPIADIVIDTERSVPKDVLVRVASRLGLYGLAGERLVDVLVGGQYGSEGKGHIAGYLAPEYDVLVRVGGPNAGHTVFARPEPDTFYHLPSGTVRAPNARIVLGPGAVLWLDGLYKELSEHEVDARRLAIDPGAMIIEQSDRDEESGGLKAALGSTAQGVGYASARKLLRGALKPPVRRARDIKELAPYIRETAQELEDAFRRGQRVFLEGTQGTGLSLHHSAEYPYVTSRDTTVSGCLSDAGIAPSRVRRTLMVCRTYPIRVQSPRGGTSGGMGQEITWEVVAERSGIPVDKLRKAEKTTTTKRDRRVAEFDWALLRRASTLNGPTDIALSFSDYLSVENQKARRFEQLTTDTIRFIEEVERVAAAPVSLVATRFHYRGIIDRRTW